MPNARIDSGVKFAESIHIMLTLYRAILGNTLQDGYAHPTTRRPPTNVPYLVDNVWEWLRPEGFPSRRACAYASPTPALALRNASVPEDARAELIVTTVSFAGRVAIAQVQRYKDAKEHPDVRALPKAILGYLGVDWPGLPVSNRLEIAPLFLPTTSIEEVESTLRTAPRGNELRELIERTCRFWSEVRLLTPVEDGLECGEGEIFFEAFDGYRLELLSGPT